MSTLAPDLLTCDPSELAEYLLTERFDKGSKETATFLLQSIAALPNAESLSEEFLRENQDSQEEVNLGDVLFEPIELSMTNPRGKFTCTLYDQGMHCITAKQEYFQILPSHAGQLIIFPKPEDVKKKGARDMLLLILQQGDDVKFRNKSLTQVCFQLPNDAAFLENLRTSLNLTKVARVGGSSGWNFKSQDESNTSTTTGGMPFVRCYHGVNDGHLYPLAEGLLFFKPPLFVPRSSLHSIACGRGASGSSRYVDMNVVLDNESTVEFTNIHREELAVLNDYIHKILIPAMKRDAEADEDNDDHEKGAVIVEDKEDNEEEEEDDDSNEYEVFMSSRRPSRKASREAREATKSQIESGVGEEEEEDEEEDHNWVSSKPHEDDDEEDEDEHLEDEEDYVGEQDDEEEEEEGFFEEEDEDEREKNDDDETEDEEEQVPAKKRRTG